MCPQRARIVSFVSRTILWLGFLTPCASLSAPNAGKFAEFNNRLSEAELMLGLSCETQQDADLTTGLTSEKIVCSNDSGNIEAAEYIVFETHTKLRVSSVFAWVEKSSSVECRHLLSTTYGRKGEAVRDRHTVGGPKNSCKSDTVIVHLIDHSGGNLSGRRVRTIRTSHHAPPLAWTPSPATDAQKSKLRILFEDMGDLVDNSMERVVVQADEILVGIFGKKSEQD